MKDFIKTLTLYILCVCTLRYMNIRERSQDDYILDIVLLILLLILIKKGA